MTLAAASWSIAPRCCDDAGCAHDPGVPATRRPPAPLDPPPASQAPTVRRPAPCPVAAAFAAYQAKASADATYARAVAALSPVERARLHRLATGTGCAVCGRPAMEGAPHCRGCAVEASG